MATQKPISKAQYIIAVLWPSFLIAGLATTLFFTLYDPVEMAHISGQENVSRLGSYTVGFFCFWLLTSLSSALTQYFQRPCSTPNQRGPQP